MQDVDGDTLPNAPKLKFVFDAQQQVPIQWHDSAIIFGGTYSYRTFAQMLPDQNPYARQPAYGLLNLNVGWSGFGGRCTVAGFVNNVTNKVCYTDVEDFFSSVAAGIIVNIKALVVKGKMVAVLAGLTGGSAPAELSEWFRIRHGKIIDHWDMAKSMKPGEVAF